MAVTGLLPNKASPQAAEMVTVRWVADARGGEGKRSYTFRMTNGSDEMVVQEGSSPAWNWVPAEPGTYRVKVIVRDVLGNVADSGWAPSFKVVPRLELSKVTPDKEAPQAAQMATVRWRVQGRGGVGKLTYAFRVSDGKEERLAQEGPSESWDWLPAVPGTYRVRVAARDEAGNAVASAWSPEYAVAQKLRVSSIAANRPPPQAAEMATVRWKAEADGGIGERTFTFRVSDGTSESVAQEGSLASWDWVPKTAGVYRIRVVVRDKLGNVAESLWSPEYRIAPRLELSSVVADKPSPQAAEMATVRWKAAATGGVGSYRYEFRTTDGREEKTEQAGVLPTWDWSPKVPGTYRVKVAVRDANGNSVDGDWSAPYTVAPPLVVSLPLPEPASPQVAGLATIRWRAVVSGGVGEKSVEFRITDGVEEKRGQEGPSEVWDWSPQVPGGYKVKAVVRDAGGNAVDTGWSPEYSVAPKLAILSLSPDKPAPQAAAVSTVRWRVDAVGGLGDRQYAFWISDGTGERAEQEGLSPSWDWSPRDPGVYRVKVVVSDGAGHIADSGWLPGYRVELTARLNSLIAVMPVQNLTGIPIDVQAVKRSLAQELRRNGMILLGNDALEAFLERHRIRYTGGLNRELAEALRTETGASCVLFAELELFDDAIPPKVSLDARLVSTHRSARILWADGVAMSGNDAPGFLLLGLVNDPAVLWARARGRLVGSLKSYLSGVTSPVAEPMEKRFLPKSFRGVPPQAPVGIEGVSIAVLPFRNDSTRRNAGEIVALHFLRELSREGKSDVVEPGEVRQVLLRSRTIMEGGLSLPQADILRADLNVDLVLTGVVMEYQDYIGGSGSPKVEFSARVFDMKTRQIVWTSSSYNQGSDGVYFFNLGKINTAHGIASEMVRAAVQEMVSTFEAGMVPRSAGSR